MTETLRSILGRAREPRRVSLTLGECFGGASNPLPTWSRLLAGSRPLVARPRTLGLAAAMDDLRLEARKLCLSDALQHLKFLGRLDAGRASLLKTRDMEVVDDVGPGPGREARTDRG
jgi:hypothetical protein